MFTLKITRLKTFHPSFRRTRVKLVSTSFVTRVNVARYYKQVSDQENHLHRGKDWEHEKQKIGKFEI